VIGILQAEEFVLIGVESSKVDSKVIGLSSGVAQIDAIKSITQSLAKFL